MDNLHKICRFCIAEDIIISYVQYGTMQSTYSYLDLCSMFFYGCVILVGGIMLKDI
jgi:hypothetical protein